MTSSILYSIDLLWYVWNVIPFAFWLIVPWGWIQFV